MVDINRRDAIAFGLAATSTTLSAPVRAAERSELAATATGERLLLNVLPTAVPGVAEPSPNPVLFWHEVGLQLVALDHSLDPKGGAVKAPGPCATARALGVANLVVADAVAAVGTLGAAYQPMLWIGGAVTTAFPDAFVGGAAARILEHIFDDPAHTQHIGTQRLAFLSRFQPAALASWKEGLAFGGDGVFTRCWNGDEVRAAVLRSPTPYIPEPYKHNVDPFNADQGFYGADWGGYPALTPKIGDLDDLKPGDPPVSFGTKPGDPPVSFGTEYDLHFDEVKELGAYKQGAPTKEQLEVGLFWAYDAARLIGTPPRLYNQIVRQVAVGDGMGTAELARLFALCNLAMADAGIVCWRAKYKHKIWRPVVGIQNDPRAGKADPGWMPFGSPRTNRPDSSFGAATKGTATAQNLLGAGGLSFFAASGEAGGSALRQQLTPYQQGAFTPNFPSFPSGHATFGTACLRVLLKIREKRTATMAKPDEIALLQPFVSDELNGVATDNFEDKSRPYVPIAYTSIAKMIKDNNDSRVHLGVHWRFDSEKGRESGELVADRVIGVAYLVA